MFSYYKKYLHKTIFAGYYLCNVIRKTNSLNVIQSEAKDLGNTLYAIEILPPFGRLNDKWFNFKTLKNYGKISNVFSSTTYQTR